MTKSPPTTRDRLIDSARFLFWERGFAGTSMAELLAHAQVNSGSFYHFFDSKEALLRAVLEQYSELLPANLSNASSPSSQDTASASSPPKAVTAAPSAGSPSKSTPKMPPPTI